MSLEAKHGSIDGLVLKTTDALADKNMQKAAPLLVDLTHVASDALANVKANRREDLRKLLE